MAIEDAGALGTFMSAIKSTSDVPARLQLFQEQRKDRVCAMQILSSWGILGIDNVIERSQPFFTTQVAPSESPIQREEMQH